MRRHQALLLVATTIAITPAGILSAAEPVDLATLLATPVPAGEPFRLVRLSEHAVFAEFASAAVRSEVLEGIEPERLAGALAGPALTLTDAALGEAYESAPGLHGAAARLRDELTALGFLPAGWERQALITLTATEEPGRLFDFSTSERMEAVAREADARDLGRSTDPGEDARLSHFGADLPSAELFEAWKFDELPDVVDEARDRDARRERLAEARRSRFLSEAVRALYWVDPAYEATVIGWVERDLRQDEIDLMARLLQVAGVVEIGPEVLVRESAPHLYRPSVLVARLFQRLEGVTVDGGRKGRRLDPDRFPDSDLLARAGTFYARIFVADDKGRFRFELTSEVGAFVDAWSARVREITRPHLERLLGASLVSGTAAGEPE